MLATGGIAFGGGTFLGAKAATPDINATGTPDNLASQAKAKTVEAVTGSTFGNSAVLQTVAFAAFTGLVGWAAVSLVKRLV